MNQEMIEDAAARLHAASARLLRQVRREQDDSGQSAPRLSALAAILRSGPLSLAQLADVERVRPPTMSRIVDGLVREGLVRRETCAADRRAVRISATEYGATFLRESRARGTRGLARRFQALGESERRALLRGIELLESLAR